MTGIAIEAALVAAAGRDTQRVQEAIYGLLSVKEWLDQRGLFETPRRLAHLLGQCAHESSRFTRRRESLNYTSAGRIRTVFGKRRFPSMADAQGYVRQPKKLANLVYGGRLGNTRPGDGWKYRGRGWLQLTGRANFRRFGGHIGVDLERWPELAGNPAGAWKIAGSYFARRRLKGRTTLQWADLGNVEMVTRIVNGGINGLDDRAERTAAALAVLKQTWPKGKPR